MPRVAQTYDLSRSTTAPAVGCATDCWSGRTGSAGVSPACGPTARVLYPLACSLGVVGAEVRGYPTNATTDQQLSHNPAERQDQQRQNAFGGVAQAFSESSPILVLPPPRAKVPARLGAAALEMRAPQLLAILLADAHDMSFDAEIEVVLVRQHTLAPYGC